MNLGEAIRTARTAKGMTQEALAEMIGVVPQTVSKWERCESQPDTELLVSLADALDTSLDRLFERQRGSWEDAKDALLRWLPCWEEESRKEQIMTLMTFAFQHLMGRWDKDHRGPDPFDFGPLYPVDGWDYYLLGDDMAAFLGTKPILPFGLFLGEGPEGWAPLFEDPDLLAPVFEALADRDCRRVILRGLSEAWYTAFPREEAAEILGVEDPEAVISRLQRFRMISSSKVRIDGEETEILSIHAEMHMLALLLLARVLYGPEGNTAGMSGVGKKRVGTPPLRRKAPEAGTEAEAPGD